MLKSSSCCYRLRVFSNLSGLLLLLLIFGGWTQPAAAAPSPGKKSYPAFKVLVLFSRQVEPDHIAFADDALKFFRELTEGREFDMDTTTDMNALLQKDLKDYALVIMLNDFPNTDAQRLAFEHYMEQGGGWLGFHVAGYNDRTTHWPWFVRFLGGAVFYSNSWPPLPARLVVDDTTHPVTRGLPTAFTAPQNEWYQWRPSPRLDKKVRVLVSLSAANYPLGLKDILRSGDTPVVWTNTDYRMVYLNMGHGAHIFSDATQNMLIINAFKWVVSQDQRGNVFD